MQHQILSRIWSFQNSHNASGNKYGKPLWEIVWQFPTELKFKIIYLLSVVLPNVYPREMKICINRKPSRRMFIAALFIIVKTGNHPAVCPSTGEQINKLAYSYNGILFRKKRIKLVAYSAVWMYLKKYYAK